MDQLNAPKEGLYEARAQKTLAVLATGSNLILPSITGKDDPYNYVFSEIKWVPMLGMKSVQSSAAVRNKDTGKTYRVVVDFYSIEKDQKPSYSKSPCRVACSCQAYYFYFAKPNEIKDAHARARVKPYVPVPLAPGSVRRPPLNPANVPGMCKHQSAYVQLLLDSRYILP